MSSGYPPDEVGTVVGTLVVEFETDSGKRVVGEAQDALRARHRFYQLRIEERDGGLFASRRQINARRSKQTTPFSATLAPGPYEITHLFLRETRGQDFSEAFSALTGFGVGLSLDFPVEKDAVTYIGRLRIRVPVLVSGTVPAIDVQVEDASEEDLRRFASIPKSRRKVRVALAEVQVVDPLDSF